MSKAHRTRKFIKNTLFGQKKKFTGVIGPDHLDNRDFIKNVPSGGVEISSTFSLSPYIDYIHDQGKVGSCTGHSTAQAVYIIVKRSMDTFTTQFSPMWIYWYAREFSGMNPAETDSGAYIRDTFKAIKQKGVIGNHHTPDWTNPYKQPPTGVQKFNIHSYERVIQTQNIIDDLKYVLGAEKLPVVISVALFENVLKRAAQTGIISKVEGADRLAGYHAITLTGYNDIGIEFVNSWGKSWGRNGYGTITYDNLGIIRDMWTFNIKYW